MFRYNTRDEFSYWYTKNHQLLKVDTHDYHALQIFDILDDLGVSKDDIKEWADNNSHLSPSLKEDIKAWNIDKAIEYEELHGHETAGLKRLVLKHNNISIRKVYTPDGFIFIFDYYGDNGLKLVKDFLIDHYNIVKRRPIVLHEEDKDIVNRFDRPEEVLECF